MTASRLHMRELRQTRIFYGYRKVRVLLIREGWQVGKKLVYRLYRQEELGLGSRMESNRAIAGGSARVFSLRSGPQLCRWTRASCFATLPKHSGLLSSWFRRASAA
jgi:hypothetical protein